MHPGNGDIPNYNPAACPVLLFNPQKRCIRLVLSWSYGASDDFDAVARAVPPKADDLHDVMAIRER